ncbi:MAG: TetR/AcrR family transcriptional regulator [Desulfurococcales archaeon]|nr:TetR/AcrR family transcriptional regulator [Desulfurococcales archaeon]
MRGDREEVRERIIRAAMRVFSTMGYFQAPASLIAKEASVSKGLLFWYFRSKDELILEVAKRSLPLDILKKCLEEGREGADLLYCIGRGYLEKYQDIIHRNLILHTMSIRTLYPQVEENLRDICENYTRRVAVKAFGNDSPISRVKIRTFFGSLLCYTLRPPKDIPMDDYLDTLIGTLLK